MFVKIICHYKTFSQKKFGVCKGGNDEISQITDDTMYRTVV